MIGSPLHLRLKRCSEALSKSPPSASQRAISILMLAWTLAGTLERATLSPAIQHTSCNLS